MKAKFHVTLTGCDDDHDGHEWFVDGDGFRRLGLRNEFKDEWNSIETKDVANEAEYTALRFALLKELDDNGLYDGDVLSEFCGRKRKDKFTQNGRRAQ